MNRQQFNSRNNIGKIFTFQKSGSTTSFNPRMSFATGQRPNWKINNGVSTILTATTLPLSYIGFSADTEIRSIKVNCESFDNCNIFEMNSDNLYGNLDLTNFTNLRGNFQVLSNPLLTGITHTPSTQTFTSYWAYNCNLTGNLNLPFSNLGGVIFLQNNPNLTGITHSPSSQVINAYNVSQCNLQGPLDITMLSNIGGSMNFGFNTGITSINVIATPQTVTQFTANNCNLTGNVVAPFSAVSSYSFQVYSNPNLTGITHSPTTGSVGSYIVHSCNLIGNLDLTPLSGIGGFFQAFSNPLLTGITHTPSNNIVTQYDVRLCNLTGNLNLPFKMGGTFRAGANGNLTGITHTQSNEVFTEYVVNNCNLNNTLDLSMLTGLGGNFNVQNNPGLTQIIHTASTQTFTIYNASSNNLIGNHFLPFTKLGGSLNLGSNLNLTGVTFSSSTNFGSFTNISFASCNLIGNLDLTPFSAFTTVLNVSGNLNLTGITFPSTTAYTNSLSLNNSGFLSVDLTPISNLGRESSTGTSGVRVAIFNCSGLTNVTLPNTTSFFKNLNNSENDGCFGLYSNNLDYVDFKPLSGATFLTGVTNGNPRITLRDNNMIVDDVNHILVDFSGNATYNPTGWSKINLNIGGSNANPDSSSGGYDGLGAIAFLTGSPYNWTITY